MMKIMYAVYTLADGMISECFEALNEAVDYCREYELTDETYGIEKYLDDDGFFAECLVEYTVDGERK